MSLGWWVVRRGLTGVNLAISDAHEGIKAATARVLSTTWQRCRVRSLCSYCAGTGQAPYKRERLEEPGWIPVGAALVIGGWTLHFVLRFFEFAPGGRWIHIAVAGVAALFGAAIYQFATKVLVMGGVRILGRAGGSTARFSWS